MKIMVVGGGGREHAIIKKLKDSPDAGQIYALPGNGGIAADAVCVPIAATELGQIVEFAVREAIDFTVVAPDDPLVMGLVDLLNEKGIACFGPTKAAAAIEGSKSFAKSLMEKYGIPTASCRVFDDYESALGYVRGAGRYPTVIKADGLALGKGVVIAQDFEAAKTALDEMMRGGRFGKSGESDVGFLLIHRPRHLIGPNAVDIERYVRIVSGKPAEHRGNDAAHGLKIALDDQLTGQFLPPALRDLHQFILDRLHQIDDELPLLHHHLACFSQRYARIRPIQQLAAQLRLHRLDRSAHALLRNIKSLRRIIDGLGMGYIDQILQIVDLHLFTSSPDRIA